MLKELEAQERVSGELEATRLALQERIDELENEVYNYIAFYIKISVPANS